MKYPVHVMLCLLVTSVVAQRPGTFEPIADYHGIGGVVASVVGSGDTPGSERLYASYFYQGGNLDVLSIDPDTGKSEVFHSPVAGETGAWGIAAEPGGNVFLGTLPHAHFLELDIKKHRLIDLGRPSATETYIWDMTFGSDGRLYGVTFPGCKLVSYDPRTGQLRDLGKMDMVQQYARLIAASKDGFLYIGIGTEKTGIVAYDISTGQHRDILPDSAKMVGTAHVFKGKDGNCYSWVGDREFLLNRWTATELGPMQRVQLSTGNTLRDGRLLSLSDEKGAVKLTITNPQSHDSIEQQIAYQGQEVALFRIGFGPDGLLYGSTVIPIHFVSINPSTLQMKEIGDLGAGEVYSFLSHAQRLLMAAYSAASTLMSYDPSSPFHLTGSAGNPTLVNFVGVGQTWRPEAMIEGPKGTVYIGAVADYGKIESPLVEWNVDSGSIQMYDTVKNQSVVSLASWRDLIVGGTEVNGGGGSLAIDREARLFIWNTKTHQKELDIVPVAGAGSITDLITAPNNLVYGIADRTLFAFDPEERKIVSKQELSFSTPIYNSAALGPDGRIYGLAPEGIFAIDTISSHAGLIAQSPVKVTGGFAIRDREIYFISGSTIYRYTM